MCFLAGCAEMERDRYWQAYGWFEKQLDQFPQGPRSGKALQKEYDIAEGFLAGKRTRGLWVHADRRQVGGH